MWSKYQAFKAGSKDLYVSFCLMMQMYAGMMLSDKYGLTCVCVQGPSMIPAIDMRDNLVLLDHFTTKFIRHPRRGEVILAENPFKPGFNIVKRVLCVEGEFAEFYSHQLGEMVKVEIPKGHIWIEGDNKENSKDSRDFGPLPLALVEGIVRYRIWPLDKINRL